MEMNEKIIPYPFQRHVNYKNYMRKNKRLPIPKRKTKRFLNEVKQWGVNLSKWEAAKEFCLDRNWEFMIITEKELGI